MKQYTRYVIVGIASNLTGYFIYLLLTYFYFGPKFAMTIVYLAGSLVSFIGNSQWTFNYRGAIFTPIIKYVLVHALGFSFNYIILYLFVDKFSYPHQYVQAVAIGVVAVFLFLMLKKIVFANPARLS